MNIGLYANIVSISLIALLIPIIIMAVATLAKVFLLFVNDQDIRFPDWVNKLIPDEAEDDAVVILIFALYAVVAFLAALLWIVVMPCLLLAGIALLTRMLIRTKKKLSWISRLTHTHTDGVEKIIEDIPPYNEL